MEVKGYKVFNPDWTCLDKKYTCPGTFEESGTLKVCGHGMHFCKQASDCFNYYSFYPKNHVAEVIARGTVKEDGDKCCTDYLEIVREIPWAELLTIVNTGKIVLAIAIRAIAIRAIAIRAISIRAIAIRAIAIRAISIRAIAIRAISIRAISIRAIAIRAIAIRAIAIRAIAIRAISIRAIAIRAVSIRAISIRAIPIWAISIRAIAIRATGTNPPSTRVASTRRRGKSGYLISLPIGRIAIGSTVRLVICWIRFPETL